jgi:hypothetical protein
MVMDGIDVNAAAVLTMDGAQRITWQCAQTGKVFLFMYRDCITKAPDQSVANRPDRIASRRECETNHGAGVDAPA